MSAVNYPLLFDDVPSITQTSTIHYPSLDQPSVASAPVDHKLNEAIHRHGNSCASCLGQFGAGKQMIATLACEHKMHQQCFVPIFVSFPLDQRHNLGGIKICKHCVELQISLGLAADEAAETRLDECLKKVKQKHREQHNDVNIDGTLQRGTRAADIKIMFGEDGISSTISSSLSSLSTLASGAASSLIETARSFRRSELGPPPTSDGGGDDFVVNDAMLRRLDAEAQERKRLELRGKELVEELLRRKRTFDVIVDTMKINIADLFNAGIDSMMLLEQLGFDLKKHTAAVYRKIIPAYFLVEKYGVSFDVHFAPMARQRQPPGSSLFDVLIRMQPTKEEALLLGITIQKLIALNITKTQLMQLDILPSSMVAYMKLDCAHLVHLRFTEQDFVNNKKWYKNVKSNESAKELYKKFLETAKK